MKIRTAVAYLSKKFRLTRLAPLIMSAYPPLFASGVRVTSVSNDWSTAHLKLKVNFLNSNNHGAAFGGALFSMTDAMLGLLVMQKLGNHYEAWTRTGTFQYLTPGRNNAHTTVHITDEMITTIRHEIDTEGYCNFPYTTVITNDDGSIVGIAQQELHCRRRRNHTPPHPSTTPNTPHREARGITLLSLSTALAWRAFPEPTTTQNTNNHTSATDTRTTILRTARRIPAPEDRARYVVKQVLDANALTREQILEMGIPPRLLPTT
ncbi:PaaI family thioesterase [Corynebacterium kroppenstedtii]|uniref:PaaI family thioesterase n=1 Tax=Corynebacterium sp. PCR 32 TaxID=3351342 RepID=UPI0030AEFE4F